MIKVDNVVMEYGQAEQAVRVLEGISFELNPAETIAIVGPSGSGKTTLLQLLAALEQPSSGTISVDGQVLSSLSEDELADFRRDNMGIVFQSFHLIESLTAQGNIALPLDIKGDANAKPKAEKMLDTVGLAHRAKHYPRQLSGGEQQRVAIARAVINEPRLLLADEPTGNLDEATGERITELLFSLHSETQATLVLVTHDLNLAKRCQRIFTISAGKLIETSSAESLVSNA